MKNQPLIVERLFNTPASKVWKALTDKEEMKNWYLSWKNLSPSSALNFNLLVAQLLSDSMCIYVK
jgi:hypothetical protein